MYIEDIIPMKNGKMKVCLLEEADFLLYKKEIQRYHLAPKQELSDEVYDLVKQEILLPRAKKRAMHLLEKMDRTEQQLRDKLKEGMYPKEVVEDAISYVKGYRYIDDNRYAATYIRIYQESRSRMRITQDLLKKGIKKDVIDFAMEENFEQSEIHQIQELLQKKGYDDAQATREARAKMFRFLAQRGYRSCDISRAMGNQAELY